MTGYLSPERQTFFESEEIGYLLKPERIKKLREVSENIIFSG